MENNKHKIAWGERLEKELSNGNSIAIHVMGYYISLGGQYGFNLKVPIFQFIEESKYNTKVLIDYLGSMMWINVKPNQVIYGNGSHKGELSPSKEGKLIRFTLESLKQ